VRDAIRALRSAERAIVICTHNLVEAEELADRITIIRRGAIIAQGTPEALKQRFLGPSEYEVQLGAPLNGWIPDLINDAVLLEKGENWIRFSTSQAEKTNPSLLRTLMDQGLPVISLQVVQRSLEQVYLQVVSDNGDMELIND
jgi:ABC-2 type transport system ATP-binding protein